MTLYRDLLMVDYHLAGQVEALRMPAPRAPARVDGLWRHTCFEVFIGHEAGPEYLEYNFSPSGEWAAYGFRGYRDGMRPFESLGPQIVARIGADSVELNVTADLHEFLETAADALRLGVTAVIEDQAGGLSYWALKHPSDKPDFHDANGFIIDL